jgi:hypothetical protein
MALTGDTVEQKIWNYLKGKGMNDCGAAGLMGNLYAESALRPNNLQGTYEKKLGYSDDAYTAAVDSGAYDNFVRDSAGYGLAQWTYWSRKQGLLSFARAAKKSVGDLETQMDFLYKELSEGYKGVLSVLKTAASVRQASDSVLLQFERPANQGPENQAARAKHGQGYYDKYAGKAPAPEGGGCKMNLRTLILTNNACYKAGRTIAVEGLMVHSTGANNPRLSRYVGPDDGLLGKNVYNNHWNQDKPGGRQVCVHAFIGKLADGSVATYQTLPWNHRGWHGGSGPKGSVNDTHIGFEICEDGLADASYFNAVYREAVELCAYLCKEYKLDPLADGVLICHAEGHKRGIASNHADVMHWFPKHGKNMDTFRADVKAAMGGAAAPAPKPEVTPPAAFAPYTVRVTADTLNIRKGPGTNYGTAGSIKDKGVYTIVGESAGPGATKWGKLKSGAGWISLDYIKKT